MINKIKVAIKEGTLFEKIKNKLWAIFSKAIVPFIRLFNKVDNNTIMLITFQGNYNCNQKAIADEIIRRKLPYKLYWAVRKVNLEDLDQYPKELNIVKRESFKFYKALAQSKFIFENSTNFAYMNLHKRKGQLLLQTWHGSMGFKRLDPKSVSDKRWVKKAKYTGDITDFCITNSKFEEDVFRESYWPKTNFLKYGHARNDCLFNKHNEFKTYLDKVHKYYNLPKDTHICLYAPTFRDNYSFESYNLDYSKLHEALVKRFGGKWCILARFHFKLREFKVPEKYINNVINATDYNDIQELLCASDVGITDYSSWMCDYVLTRRPGFLYASDIQEYVDDERGFYYPLKSTPFKVAEDSDELVKRIMEFDDKEYQVEIDKFLKERGCYESGDASKKIVDKLIELSK